MRSKISGIYFIRNKINNHFYIGSSIDINKRISVHKRDLFKKKHHSPILQRVYNKYGLNNLIFEIFINCEKDDLLILEQFCLNTLTPLYNVAKDALAPMAGRKHSRKTKFKFKKIKWPKGKNHPNYGKKASLETRQRMSEKRKLRKWSEKTKRKMSRTAIRVNSIGRVDQTKRRKKVIDSMGIIHKSLIAASKFWDISVQAVCDNLKNRSEWSRPGVKFFYV